MDIPEATAISLNDWRERQHKIWQAKGLAPLWTVVLVNFYGRLRPAIRPIRSGSRRFACGVAWEFVDAPHDWEWCISFPDWRPTR